MVEKTPVINIEKMQIELLKNLAGKLGYILKQVEENTPVKQIFPKHTKSSSGELKLATKELTLEVNKLNAENNRIIERVAEVLKSQQPNDFTKLFYDAKGMVMKERITVIPIFCDR